MKLFLKRLSTSNIDHSHSHTNSPFKEKIIESSCTEILKEYFTLDNSSKAKIRIIPLKKICRIINSIYFEVIDKIYFKKDKYKFDIEEPFIGLIELLLIYFNINFGLDSLAKKKFKEFIHSLLQNLENSRVTMFCKLLRLDMFAPIIEISSRSNIKNSTTKDLRQLMIVNNLERRKSTVISNLEKRKSMIFNNLERNSFMPSNLDYDQIFSDFVLRHIILIIQNIKVCEAIIRDSNLDDKYTVYIIYDKIKDILAATLFKLGLSDELKNKIHIFIIENNKTYIKNMKIKKVINFDDFLSLAKEILFIIWTDYNFYLNTIYKSMTLGTITHDGNTGTLVHNELNSSKLHGLSYFDFLVVTQYIFNTKISLDRLERLFRKAKNHDGVIDYRVFEKIIVENDLFDLSVFKSNFLKIEIDEIHNILHNLAEEVNNSASITIIDNIDSRIKYLQKDSNYNNSINEQMDKLTELSMQWKKKVVTYKDKEMTGKCLYFYLTYLTYLIY